MLRLAGTDKALEDQLRPIPFPRHRVAGRHADAPRGRPGSDSKADNAPDTGSLIDAAIEDVQSRLADLDAILDEPIRFPGCDSDDDSPPPAA